MALPAPRIPAKYRIEHLKFIREKYHIGQKINYVEVERDGRYKTKTFKELEVVEKYPNFLSCIDKHGKRYSLNYFGLEMGEYSS